MTFLHIIFDLHLIVREWGEQRSYFRQISQQNLLYHNFFIASLDKFLYHSIRLNERNRMVYIMSGFGFILRFKTYHMFLFFFTFLDKRFSTGIRYSHGILSCIWKFTAYYHHFILYVFHDYCCSFISSSNASMTASATCPVLAVPPKSRLISADVSSSSAAAANTRSTAASTQRASRSRPSECRSNRAPDNHQGWKTFSFSNFNFGLKIDLAPNLTPK